jgi:hypothetical protein
MQSWTRCHALNFKSTGAYTRPFVLLLFSFSYDGLIHMTNEAQQKFSNILDQEEVTTPQRVGPGGGKRSGGPW